MKMIKACLFLYLMAFSGIVMYANQPSPFEKRLNKLTNIYEYYFFQLKNSQLTETQKNKCEKKLMLLGKKIGMMGEEIGYQKTDSSGMLNDIIALLPEQKPVYAHEPKTLLVNIGTSFSGLSYFQPFHISFEKAFTGNKTSIGGYACFFTEKQKPGSGNIEEHSSYTFVKQLYKYNYVGFGIRGSYHLLNLEPLNLSFNSKIVDMYATAVIGYSIAFLKTDLANSTVAVMPPGKEGINAGALLGIRFFLTDEFSIFSEAGYSKIAYLNLGFGYRFLPSVVNENGKKD